MMCFEVSLNGEKLAVAGINEFGVLTTIITWVRKLNTENEEIELNLSGLDSETREQLKWLNQPLSCNDEILIRIVEAESDKPLKITMPEEMDGAKLESKIKYYYQLKEELKDHLKEEGN